MGTSLSTEDPGHAMSPEELSHSLASRFANKCFTHLELTHLKDNFSSRAVDQGGFRYWNEEILSDFLGIPDGAGALAEKDVGPLLDAGPVIFRMVSYLGAFPFQTTLAPAVLTFEALVKVIVLLTEKYGKILKRGRRDRVRLLFGSLADVGRKDVRVDQNAEPRDGEDTTASQEHASEEPRSNATGFSVDQPMNDEEEDDDDDLALAALESLDAIEVFKHDHRIDRTIYESRISMDTFRRLLMLLLAIAPLKPLEGVTKYTKNLDPERIQEIHDEAEAILATFTSGEETDGISYKSFARTITGSLPYLFDPLTPLFEHLLFSKNLDLSRKREDAGDSAAPQSPPPSPPTTPVALPGSFDSSILNPAILSHLSFFVTPSAVMPNLFRSKTRLHPLFSTAAHGESLTSFSHHVMTWQAPTLLLLQGAYEDDPDEDIMIGAYLPEAWKSPTSTSMTRYSNTSDPSTLPCLFQLKPSHILLQGNPSAYTHREDTPAAYFSEKAGISLGCFIPPKASQSRQKATKPSPRGGGSLIIDPGLATANFIISPTHDHDGEGPFLRPVAGVPQTPHREIIARSLSIYDFEVWGFVPDPSSQDPQNASAQDAIARQQSQWNWEVNEVERRRNVNLKVAGDSDAQTARALLEMAGMVENRGANGQGRG